MTTQIDQVVQDLFKKLEERKAKVAELKQAGAKNWRTNCSFVQIGATAPTNVQTATDLVIETLATNLEMITSFRSAAAIALGRPASDKIQGYTYDDWLHDFKKRLAMIEVRVEETKLAELEARLNSVLSPEERRRIEVAMLAAEL